MCGQGFALSKQCLDSHPFQHPKRKNNNKATMFCKYQFIYNGNEEAETEYGYGRSHRKKTFLHRINTF